MGYILKKGSGGGGDATAANQQTQITQLGNILFDTTDIKSAILKSTVTTPNTLVISFADSTPATLATQLQTFLQGNIVTIISITYADAGGLGANPHSCLVVYQF